MSVWSVDLCYNWIRLGQLQGDAFEFHGVERFRDLGEWNLVFSDGAASWTYYTNDDGDEVPCSPRDVDTVRLVEDGAIRYAGYVGQASQGSGGIERLRDADGVRWSLSGLDLWDILRTRVAFPVPATADPSSWSSSHDVNSGVASTVLAAYLSDNLGATAISARAISGFAVADNVVGTSGDWSARLQPLFELARRILDDADINIRWTVTFAGAVTATIGLPRDLSSIYVLSDQADLTSVRARFVPAKSTWVAAGGTGTGTGRLFRYAETAATGMDRRERFVEVASLSQAAEVEATAEANLRLDADTWVVSGEVVDSVTEAIGFGRTVFVGDKITIQAFGERFVVPVASLAWHITSDRQVVRPTLGEATPDALKGLLADVANLSTRFDNDIA